MPALRYFLSGLLLLTLLPTGGRADDVDICRQTNGDESLAACTRLLAAKKLRGGELVNAYLWRGLVYARFKRDYDKAIADYSQALKIDPNSSRGYAFRAGSLLRKGDDKKAEADLAQALRLDPKNPAAHSGLGTLYNKRGDYDRALVELSQAIQLYPQQQFTLYAYLNRAIAYENKGEFNKALADFRTALNLDPGKREVAGQEATEGIQRVEQRFAAGGGGADWTTCSAAFSEEKIAACARLIASGKLRGSDLAQAHAQRGFSLVVLKADCDSAIRDFDQAIRLEPGNAPVHATRGACYVRKGNLDRALVDLNDALRINPNNAAVHNAFGFYYNARGDYNRALVELNQALRINPQLAAAYKNRGVTYENKGELAAAVADFRVALTFDPAKRQIVVQEAAQGIQRIEQKLARGDGAKIVATAPPTPQPAAVPMLTIPQRRVALVVGNSNYRHATQLANPTNDAADIAAALGKLGFDVVEGRDLDKRGMEDKIREFGRKLEGADLALMFYAGHGMQVAGKNYLVPIDAKLERAGDLTLDTIEVGQVLVQMEAEKRVNLIFLDACRDNPLARSFSRSLGTRSTAVGHGLASIQSAVGTLIAYATQPDNVALDGEGRNSPFTTALLKNITTPGLEISALMKRVRADVIANTREKQVPWDHSSLVGDVILAR